MDHTVDRDVNGVADGAGARAGQSRRANAINTTLNNPTGDPQASPRRPGRYVRLNRGSIINNSSIIAKGEGPGGKVTGMATLNGDVYAVSDQGGLYRINDPFNDGGQRRRCPDHLHRDVQRGPAGHPLLRTHGRAAECGERGRTTTCCSPPTRRARCTRSTRPGEAQPVFANGATSVSTGDHNRREVRGLAFSTLDHEPVPAARRRLPTVIAATSDGRAARQGDVRSASRSSVDKQQFDAGPRVRYRTRHVEHPLRPGQRQRRGPRQLRFPRRRSRLDRQQRIQPEGLLGRRRPALYFSYFLDTENDSSDPLDRRRA